MLRRETLFLQPVFWPLLFIAVGFYLQQGNTTAGEKKTIQRLDLLNTLLIRNWQQSMQEEKTERDVCVCGKEN